MKRLNSHAIACCAACISSVSILANEEQKAEDPKDKLECSKQVARYHRDSIAWLTLLGATPSARQRMGITSSAKTEGPPAKVLKRKQQSQGY
jgi:hypothetical protein